MEDYLVSERSLVLAKADQMLYLASSQVALILLAGVDSLAIAKLQGGLECEKIHITKSQRHGRFVLSSYANVSAQSRHGDNARAFFRVDASVSFM